MLKKSLKRKPKIIQIDGHQVRSGKVNPGKKTLLDTLINETKPHRIITIEDTPELSILEKIKNHPQG